MSLLFLTIVTSHARLYCCECWHYYTKYPNPPPPRSHALFIGFIFCDKPALTVTPYSESIDRAHSNTVTF